MSKGTDQRTPASQPVTTKDASTQVITKELRGGYLGPKGEPVQMTQSTLVNPSPTSQQTNQPSGDTGTGNG
jgi:hypothetical protein